VQIAAAFFHSLSSKMPLSKADTDIISQGGNRVGLPDRCSSEIVNPSDTFLELMMLTPLKDGRQVSRNASEVAARQTSTRGKPGKSEAPATEAMPVENLEKRLNQQAQQVNRQQSGHLSPAVPPPAFCARPGSPARDEAPLRQNGNAALGARSVPRLPNTQPLLSPRTAKSQWASRLAPVMETPVPSRSSFRPPVRTPQAATRDTIRSSTPQPSYRATLGMTNVAQQQQQQQLNQMRSRSYQPPRPLQQSPSRSQPGVPRINPPAGLLQAPPAPPPPPARAATPGRGAASPLVGRSSPHPRSPQPLPGRAGGPNWGLTGNHFHGMGAVSKSSDKRELMIAAHELDEEAGSGIMAQRTMSRLSCASSSASEAQGWRSRRGNTHSCCC